MSAITREEIGLVHQRVLEIRESVGEIVKKRALELDQIASPHLSLRNLLNDGIKELAAQIQMEYGGSRFESVAKLFAASSTLKYFYARTALKGEVFQIIKEKLPTSYPPDLFVEI